MNPRGIGWPLIGKLRTARWVEAPYRASAGTAISPIESRSMRVSMPTIVGGSAVRPPAPARFAPGGNNEPCARGSDPFFAPGARPGPILPFVAPRTRIVPTRARVGSLFAPGASRPCAAPAFGGPLLHCGDGVQLGHVPARDGPLRDRRDGRDRVRRRRTGRDHGQRAELGEPGAPARDDRPRPAPAHRAGRPRGGSLRRQRARARARSTSPTASPAPTSSRVATSSAARRGGRARPACRSSTGRSPRSSARSSRPCPSATTTCSSAGSTRWRTPRSIRARCSTSGGATCASRRPGPSCPRAGRSNRRPRRAHGPRERARRRIRPRRAGRCRPGDADPDPAPRRDLDRGGRLGRPATAPRSRRSGSTCPMPAATAGPAGTSPTAGPTASSWTISRPSWTPSASTGSTSPGSRWAP